MAEPLILENPFANAADLNVEILKQNPTWDDMLAAFDGMMATNVDAPIAQLETIRYLDPLAEVEVLQKTTRMLGFDASQDVLAMSAENLTRLVTQLPLYPDYNSTLLFQNFIDLLLNSITSIEYLFTKDYVNFYPYPKGDMITEGGPWFKTTHISLYVELLNPESLDVISGKPLFRRVLDVFYTFCPIALVIKNFFFTIKYDLQYGYAVTLLPPDLEVDIDH